MCLPFSIYIWGNTTLNGRTIEYAGRALRGGKINILLKETLGLCIRCRPTLPVTTSRVLARVAGAVSVADARPTAIERP